MNRLVSLSLSMLVAVPLFAQEKRELRYTLAPGQVVWVEQLQDSSMVMKMGENEMKTGSVTTMWCSYTTKSVEGGVATVEMRYERIAIRSDRPKVDYDSDVPGSKPGMMKSVADLVGKTAMIQLDAQGKVVKVEGSEEMDEALEKTGASLKSGLEQAFAAWPKEAVGVGDSWTNETEYPMGQMGTMKAKITNKLAAIKGGEVVVDYQLDMDLSGAKLPAGMKMEVESAKGSATTTLDSFAPVSSVMEMHLTMAGDKAPGAMKMVMRQTMKRIPTPAPKAAKPAAEKDEKPAKAGK